MSAFIVWDSSGTNLEALITSTKKPSSYAQIVLVISNKAGVEGLKKAERAGIPTKVRDSHSTQHLLLTETNKHSHQKRMYLL